MTEKRVFFQGDGRLEGMLGYPPTEETVPAPARRGGVVVAHPYPPHGATMDIPVVYRIAQFCQEKGFATLRFNFRSAGKSEGDFSGTEEHRDVAAAVSYLNEQLSQTRGALQATPQMGLAGWSFGSVMAARAVAELPEVEALALVGFPVEWELLPADTLERLGRYRGPLLAVCADNDQHGTPEKVAKVLLELGLAPRMEVVAGADHYLIGREKEVAKLVTEFFDEVLR